MAASFTIGNLFDSTITSGYTPRWVSQVYATDLNSDGNSDLLVIGASYPSDGAPVAQPGFVAFGNGAGGFTLATEKQFPISTLKTVHPREVVFADFNGDGRPDVYVAGHGYDAMPFPGQQNLLYLSNPDGTWRNATSTLPQVSDFTHGASAGDINGDGYLDIVVGNVPQPNPIHPYLLLNDGAGRFTRSDSALPTGTGQVLNQLQTRMTSQLLSDLNQDGLADLVVGSLDSTASKPKPPLILWNAQGEFKESNMTVLPSPKHFGADNSVYDIQSLDLNADGRKDLIIAYQKSIALGGWELQILINDGNRGFSDQTSRYIPEESAQYGGFPSANSAESQYWVQFVNLIDLNSDGRMDFVLDARGVTSAPAAMPVAYVQQGDGSFQAAKVSDLASGYSWFFDYTTQVVTWSGQTGFAKLGIENGVVKVYTIPATFAPVLPVRTDFSDPVSRFGTSRDDALFGGRGGDTFKGGSGNDSIDGGLGTDTAQYSTTASNYIITNTTVNGATGYTVKDKTGADGVDTLVDVERLKFADKSFALDFNGVGGQAYRIYQAAFNRTPDSGGVGYWMSVMDGGAGLKSVAGGFVNSAEFKSIYGANPTNAEIVTRLYDNVLKRPGEPGGYAFWLGVLDRRDGTVADVLAAFSESQENQDGVISLIGNGFEYTPFG